VSPCRSILLILLCGFASSSTATEEEFRDLIAQVVAKSETLAADLAAHPAPLPAPADNPEIPPPPDHLRSAPAIFLTAWEELCRFRAALPPSPRPEPASPKIPIDNNERSKMFLIFLRELLSDEAPPSLAEAYRFYYQRDPVPDASLDTSPLEAAITVCHLRNNDVPGAIHPNLIHRQPAVYANLLTHLGFDADLVRLGQWASHPRYHAYGNEMGVALCRHSSDRIANALLDWQLTYWEQTMARKHHENAEDRKPDHQRPSAQTHELLLIFTPDNSVSDPVKLRVSKFILKHGEELQPTGVWLMYTPKGGEKWMADFAKRALSSPTNQTRNLAIVLLERAGLPFDKPTLTAPPLYRLSLNGKPWPGDLTVRPSLYLHLESFGALATSGSLSGTSLGSDVFKVDPDEFAEHCDLVRTRIESRPYGFSGKPIDPQQPWLKQTIPGPPRFGETTAIDLLTSSLTVSPVYPEARPANDKELDAFRLWRPSRSYHQELPASYTFPQGAELTLAHLSPGEYFYQLIGPNARMMTPETLLITDQDATITPNLLPSTTLIVPLGWKDGQIPVVRQGEVERWAIHQAPLVSIQRDGKPVDYSKTPPADCKATFPTSAIFSGLGPGTYEISIPSFEFEAGEFPNGLIKLRTLPTSLTFVVTPDSAPLITTLPLPVHLEQVSK